MRQVRLAILAFATLALVGCGTGVATVGPSQAVATSGPGPSAPQTTQAALTPWKYAFSVKRTILWPPYYIAEELGYFEDEGLDVEFVYVSGGGASMQQVLGGSVDVGVSAGALTLNALDSDQDVVWFYTYIHEILNSLVVPATSDIQDLAGLKGKIIGISEPSGGEVPVLRGLMSNIGYVEGRDYTVLPVGDGGALTLEALRNGDVDAYISTIFDVSTMTAAGLEVRDIFPEKFKNHPGLGDVVTRATWDTKKDQITAFGRAIAKGTVFMQANPEAAKAIAKKHQPEIFEDQGLADAWWTAVTDKMQPPADAPSKLFGAHYMPGWENYIELASQGTAEEGALQGPFDLPRHIDGSLIEEINNFDHAAIQAEAAAYKP
jgi:ABC-type nitrate/sulfonate/bicarbonate transport system substrate-binding protein